MNQFIVYQSFISELIRENKSDIPANKSFPTARLRFQKRNKVDNFFV